jgi:septal ring factor EnvC (AmiA/AmiB activator)
MTKLKIGVLMPITSKIEELSRKLAKAEWELKKANSELDTYKTHTAELEKQLYDALMTLERSEANV